MVNVTPAALDPNKRFCPDCSNVMTWDPDGSMSGLGEPCWYCLPPFGCGNIVPPSPSFPPPVGV